MYKVFAFVINKENKLLLLKGSPNDPQYHKSFWYVVTGGKEKEDDTFQDTVVREVKEETNLDVIEVVPLEKEFIYESLGEECHEFVYACFVEDGEIILNEESIDYKWCDKDKFIELIEWEGDKKELVELLNLLHI